MNNQTTKRTSRVRALAAMGYRDSEIAATTGIPQHIVERLRQANWPATLRTDWKPFEAGR